MLSHVENIESATAAIVDSRCLAEWIRLEIECQVESLQANLESLQRFGVPLTDINGEPTQTPSAE